LASALATACEGPECFEGAGGPYEGSEIAESKARAGYLRTQNDRLSQLTRNQLNKLMGSSQRGLIGKWFGNSVAGAQKALEGPADPGSEISNETLQIYRQLALRSIAVGKDTLGVQALRLRLVERALNYRFEEESFYR
jgi:hypothetical protein